MTDSVRELFDEFTEMENTCDDGDKKNNQVEYCGIASIDKFEKELMKEYQRGYALGAFENGKKIEIEYQNKIEIINKHVKLKINELNEINNSRLDKFIKKITNSLSKIVYSKITKINNIEIINNELNDIFSCIKYEKIINSLPVISEISHDDFFSPMDLPIFKAYLDKTKIVGDYNIDWGKGNACRNFSENLSNILGKYISE